MGRYKIYFDQKHRCMRVEPGDLVMVRIKAFGRDHKIADKWESVPYRVLNQNGKKPVFMVQSVKESGTRNIRTLHRNMLFPLSSKQYENVLEQDSRTELLAKSNILMAQHRLLTTLPWPKALPLQPWWPLTFLVCLPWRPSLPRISATCPCWRMCLLPRSPRSSAASRATATD